MSGARGFLIVAVVVMAALTGLHYAVRPCTTERNHEFMTEMVYSKAAESFSTSDVLPGGTTQQHLVAGVVGGGGRPRRDGGGGGEGPRAAPA